MKKSKGPLILLLETIVAVIIMVFLHLIIIRISQDGLFNPLVYVFIYVIYHEINSEYNEKVIKPRNEKIRKTTIDEINYMKETKEPQTYIFVHKCKNNGCELEYAVYSWNKDWNLKYNSFCPECGNQESVLLTTLTSDKMISTISYSGNIN